MKNYINFERKDGHFLEFERFDNGSVSVEIRVPVAGSEGDFRTELFFLEGEEVEQAINFLKETLHENTST